VLGDAQAVVEFALEQSAYGQVRVANELRKRSILVSPAGVRTIWVRHDLQTFQLRMKSLSAKVAQDGLILTGRSKSSTLVLGIAGHALRRQPERRWPDLSADLHRYAQQARVREALRSQERDRCRGYAQRSGVAVLRGVRRVIAANPNRSRQHTTRRRRVRRRTISASGSIRRSRTSSTRSRSGASCFVRSSLWRLGIQNKLWQ
jgi:hypothetical protein